MGYGESKASENNFHPQFTLTTLTIIEQMYRWWETIPIKRLLVEILFITLTCSTSQQRNILYNIIILIEHNSIEIKAICWVGYIRPKQYILGVDSDVSDHSFIVVNSDGTDRVVWLHFEYTGKYNKPQHTCKTYYC